MQSFASPKIRALARPLAAAGGGKPQSLAPDRRPSARISPARRGRCRTRSTTASSTAGSRPAIFPAARRCAACCRSGAIDLPPSAAFDTIHLGGENPRVDFSTFCFRPTLIGRWARCVIASPKAQSVRFAVETCGGVHLWCGERKLLAHEPYDRNGAHRGRGLRRAPGRPARSSPPSSRTCTSATRSCYFQLTLLEGDGLQAGLEAEIDPDRLRDVEATLNGLRTDRLFHAGGAVRVVSDHLPAEPLEVELVRRAYPDAELPGTVRFTISRDAPSAELFAVEGLRPGCLALTFRARLGGIALERELGTTLLPPALRLDQPTLAERKRAAIAAMQRGGGDNPARALAAARDRPRRRGGGAAVPPGARPRQRAARLRRLLRCCR